MVSLAKHHVALQWLLRRAYSLTYAKGKVDVNGDSYRGNSLIYIPTEAEMGTMP